MKLMKTNGLHHSVKQFVVLALTALMALASFTAAGVEKILFDKLNLNGTEVKNVRVSKVTPVSVIVLYDGGGSQCDRKNLPPELAALFPYDCKAAAEYERQQEVERQERARRLRERQGQANQEYKHTLLRQRQSVKERLEVLEREMVLLDQQIALAWSKAARRPRSIERQEYNRLVEQKQALAKKQGEHQDLLRSVDRQLSLIP